MPSEYFQFIPEKKTMKQKVEYNNYSIIIKDFSLPENLVTANTLTNVKCLDKNLSVLLYQVFLCKLIFILSNGANIEGGR